MAISYINAADFDAVVDSKARVRLFTDDGDSGSESDTRFARAVELASAIALASAKQAGYDPAAATTDDMIKATALSLLVHMAYGRKAREIPTATAAILAPLPEAVRTGELPLTDEAIANATEAVGGTVFTGDEDNLQGSSSIRIKRAPVMRNLANIL